MNKSKLEWNAIAEQAAELGLHAFAYKVLHAVHVENIWSETYQDGSDLAYVPIETPFDKQMLNTIEYHLPAKSIY